MTPCSLGSVSGFPQTVLAETLDSCPMSSVLGRRLEALCLWHLLRSTFPTGTFPPQAPRIHAEHSVPAHRGACACGPRAMRRGPDESSTVL